MSPSISSAVTDTHEVNFALTPSIAGLTINFNYLSFFLLLVFIRREALLEIIGMEYCPIGLTGSAGGRGWRRRSEGEGDEPLNQ